MVARGYAWPGRCTTRRHEDHRDPDREAVHDHRRLRRVRQPGASGSRPAIRVGLASRDMGRAGRGEGRELVAPLTEPPGVRGRELVERAHRGGQESTRIDELDR